MLTIIVLILALAAAAPFLHRLAGRRAGWLYAAVSAGWTLWFVRALPLEAGERIREVTTWMPSLGVELAFVLDGLSATFAILIGGIGALILLYASGYLADDPRLGRFYLYMLLFQAAMLGIVLADNLVVLFVFWELTSISSYLLIGYYHQDPTSRASALKALFVTGAGGVVLLAGVLMIGLAAGDFGLSGAETLSVSALERVDLREHGLYLPLLLCVLFGAFTKSAQLPFHFWLPAAMAAPTPVSAYLHSATMVKAGVYLLARLHPHLGQTTEWYWIVTGFGVVTMLVAAGMALGQTDLKRILAYSTCSVLGILTMLIGVGTATALKAAVVFLVAHALYKAALFMIAGNIDHETGTRDASLLGGLRRLMPLSAAAGLLAALSKSGAPPMFGFIGKELVYKAKIDLEMIGAVLVTLAVVANVALVATALLAGVRPFFGRLRETPKKAHEAPPSMVAGPLILGIAGLFVGLLPGYFDKNLGSGMASAMAGEPLEMKLKLWAGVSPDALIALGLSVITLAAGVGVFNLVRTRLVAGREFVAAIGRYGPSRGFERGLDGLYAGAGMLTRAIQGGMLRRYVTFVVLIMVAATLVPAWRAFDAGALRGDPELRAYEVLVVVMILAGAIVAAVFRSRLTSVAGLGVTGLGVAFVFLIFGAPDLAITQIMVETLTVILLVFVFYHLPPLERRTSTATRLRDLVVALAAGASVTLAVLAASIVRWPGELTSFFAEASVPEAYGRNIVNVILVDFRALDTLGEIIVVGVAGIGVYALLRLRPRRREGRTS